MIDWLKGFNSKLTKGSIEYNIQHFSRTLLGTLTEVSKVIKVHNKFD